MFFICRHGWGRCSISDLISKRRAPSKNVLVAMVKSAALVSEESLDEKIRALAFHPQFRPLELYHFHDNIPVTQEQTIEFSPNKVKISN